MRLAAPSAHAAASQGPGLRRTSTTPRSPETARPRESHHVPLSLQAARLHPPRARALRAPATRKTDVSGQIVLHIVILLHASTFFSLACWDTFCQEERGTTTEFAYCASETSWQRFNCIALTLSFISNDGLGMLRLL